MRWPWTRPAPAVTALPGWPAAAAEPDGLAADLTRHLYAAIAAVAPGERRQCSWVMTLDWFRECQGLDGSGWASWQPGPPPAEVYLLGLPVAVREGSGPPHLERRQP